MFSELAELLKTIPKDRNISLRQLKELENKKEAKKPTSIEPKGMDNDRVPDNGEAPAPLPTSTIPENYDFLIDKPIDSADKSQLLNDDQKKTQLIGGQEIIVDNPNRITFTTPELNGSYMTWNLYEKQTEAFITRYVKATPETGPDMWLRPYNSEVEGVGEVKLKADGFSQASTKLKWTASRI